MVIQRTQLQCQERWRRPWCLEDHTDLHERRHKDTICWQGKQSYGRYDILVFEQWAFKL